MKVLRGVLLGLLLSSSAIAQTVNIGGSQFPLTKGGSFSFAWQAAAPGIGNPITKDTIHGLLKGTLLAGRTYYMDSDITINAGDTLLMQPGVTIIALGTSTLWPEIQMYGTFISMGTKDQPNFLTVLPIKRLYANLTVGLWAGIHCALNSGDLILHWTHVEFAGGYGTPLIGSKSFGYSIWFQNPSANFILEDSWISGGVDDPIRITSGRISVMRNVFEAGAGGVQTPYGDGLNMKAGTVGDVAYNLFLGMCTNGPKLSNIGGGPIQTNVNIYNNTIVTCGWRYVGTGRAGSTNIEDGARGTEYNNLIINCKTGFRLVGNPLADTAHVFYDYQWYYAATDSIRAAFYPNDGIGIQVPKPHDRAGVVKANDPMFVGYDVNQVSSSDYVWPISWTNQDPVENVKISSHFSDIPKTFTSDFHLQPTSPCLGVGFTGPAPVTIPMAVCPQASKANPYGATTLGLGKDIGAYQSDGTGNQQ